MSAYTNALAAAGVIALETGGDLAGPRPWIDSAESFDGTQSVALNYDIADLGLNFAVAVWAYVEPGEINTNLGNFFFSTTDSGNELNAAFGHGNAANRGVPVVRQDNGVYLGPGPQNLPAGEWFHHGSVLQDGILTAVLNGVPTMSTPVNVSDLAGQVLLGARAGPLDQLNGRLSQYVAVPGGDLTTVQALFDGPGGSPLLNRRLVVIQGAA